MSYPDPVLTARRLEPTLGREMAGIDQVERWGNYTFRNEDPHPSEILATRSECKHRIGELYEDMLGKDIDLAGIVAKRSDAVMALPRLIVPADASPQAKEIAEFCVTALGGISGFAINLQHQLESRFAGVAFEELVWEKLQRGPLSGAVVPVAMIDRPMWRFAFVKGELRVRQAGTIELLTPPPGKFLRFAHGTKDSAWGKGLADKVYWYWFIKKHGWKWFAHSIEKWGAPTAVGSYRHRQGTDDQTVKDNQRLQAQTLELLEAVQNNLAAAVPEGVVVTLLEAVRGGSANYPEFLELCTRGMALLFNGEINTSGLRPGTGSFASDKIATDIRKEKVALDAHDLGAHLKDNVLRPMVEINFGPGAPVPSFEIDSSEIEDREERRQGIELLLKNGLPVTKRHMYMVGLASEPRPGEEIVEAPKPVPAIPPPPVAPPAPAPPTPPAPDPVAAAEPHGSVHLAEDKILTAAVAESEARDSAIAEIAAAFVPGALEYYAHQQELILEAWDKGLVTEGRALQWVVDRLHASSNAQMLEVAQIHGIGLAFQHLAADGITEPLLMSGRPVGLPINTAADLPMGMVPGPRFSAHLAAPSGFEAATTPATAVDFWAQLLNLGKSVFAALLPSNKRFAFAIAGLNDASVLTDASGLMGRAVAEGWTRQRFRDELDGLYTKRGLTPEASWHTDLVYANGTRTASGIARYQNTVGNPATHRMIPYMGWATLGDDRVRARPQHNHVVMANQIFAISHEIWRTWWYPAGHNCRCYAYTINRLAAQRLGLVGAEPTGPWPTTPEGGRAYPDPGFAGAPDLGNAVVDAQQRLTDLLSSAQETGSPDLIAALRALLTQLLGFDPFAAPTGGQS